MQIYLRVSTIVNIHKILLKFKMKANVNVFKYYTTKYINIIITEKDLLNTWMMKIP